MVSKENNADELASNAIQSINSLEHQDELERISIISRLSKLEADTRTLFEMQDKK